jgi:hypothetical protein
MNIDVNIVSVILGAVLALVSTVTGWLVNTVIGLMKQVVVVETRLETTDGQVEEIKSSIRKLDDTISFNHNETKEYMMDLMREICNVKAGN